MTNDDERGPVIRVWASTVRGGGKEPRPPAKLTTSAPIVRRYNDWGHWNPLVLTVPPTADFDVFGERELAAALWYRQQTSCAGIEFVAITTHSDEAPFQTLSSGMCLVPLQDPDWKAEAFPRPPYRIYDGWFPVDDDGVEASRAGLRAIEDTLDFYAYQHGIKLRWIVKYTELLGGDLTRGMRSVSDADDAAFRERLSRLLDLPAPLQAAVRRSAHWHQNFERQERKTDRFLALWLALESLLLVLHDQCGPIGLLVVQEEAGLTKAQRRALRDRLAEDILATRSDLPTSERVRTAYFEAVVPIQRQVKAVLRAVFESDEHNEWLFDKNGRTSPAELRSKIVHEGLSEAEAVNACPLEDYCRRLDRLLRELIERVLRRQWGGTCALPRFSYSSSVLAENGFAGPSAEHAGDFRISLGLMLRKGLVELV